jgi:hypothetical protein
MCLYPSERLEPTRPHREPDSNLKPRNDWRGDSVSGVSRYGRRGWWRVIVYSFPRDSMASLHSAAVLAYMQSCSERDS